MLKANFAERAIEISEVSTAIPIAVFSQDNHEPESRLEAFDGNAFNGSQANRQFAELQIQQNALGGGHTGDPLINVRGKLLGQFDAASGKKNDERAKDMMMSLMMQQLYQDLQEQLAQIDADLNTLSDIQRLMEEGSFDPLKNDEHLKMLQQIDADMTRETWDAMAMHEQTDWLQDHVDRLNAERAETVANIEIVSDPDAAIPAVNNRFESELFEIATQNYERKTGEIVDRHNPSEGDKDRILEETYNLYLEQHMQSQQLNNIAQNEYGNTQVSSNLGIQNPGTRWG